MLRWSVLTALTTVLTLGSFDDARAASVSGTIRTTSGTGLASANVRLWVEGDKGLQITAETTAASNGTYSFTGLPAGNYAIDARQPVSSSANLGDRWYDVAEPFANGYVSTAADILVLGESTNQSGIDVTLETLGALNGRVLVGGNPRGDVWARVQQIAHPGIVRVGLTRDHTHSVRHGDFYMRGVPPGAYEVIIHDPNGVYATHIAPGPYNVTIGGTVNTPAITLSPAPADPYEPNDTPAQSGANNAFDDAIFRSDPPGVFESVGSRIGPRNNGDVDWTCFDVQAGDRFLLTASTTLPGRSMPHPWMDPILSLWNGDGTLRVLEDDDSGPGHWDAHLDTGPIAFDTRVCAAVSTFGDTTWSGVGQGSAGPYTLTIEMGNRPPRLEVRVDGILVEPGDDPLELEEGTSITFDIVFDDPDHDALTPTLTHTTHLGDPVLDGVFEVSGGVATYTWEADYTAARDGPYTVEVSLTDGEFTEELAIIVHVEGVNLPPTTPALLAPDDLQTVDTLQPQLVIGNATDPNLDALSYDFELRYGSEDATVVQSALVPEHASGETTSWMPGPLPENTWVYWRARAYDGQDDDPYSPWSPFHRFFVDTVNDPPAAPAFYKPADGQLLFERRPALAATNPLDPEGDAVTLTFQLAHDVQFTSLVLTSPPVPLDTAGPTTAWTPTLDLDWGGTYFGRAQASDDRGGVSPYSNVHAFHLKENVPPTAPALDATCEHHLYEVAPTEIVVTSVEDPEGEAMTLELQVFAAGADPDTATPLAESALAHDPAEDEHGIPIPAGTFDPGAGYLIRVRASDGTDAGPWTECAIWVDNPDALPTAVVIVSPAPETVLAHGATTVNVQVQNAEHPFPTHPRAALWLAYCVDDDPDLAGCDPDPIEWTQRPQSSMASQDLTMVQVTGLGPGPATYFHVCALDERGRCGPAATTSFSVSDEPEPVDTGEPEDDGGCGCASGGGSPSAALLLAGLLLVRRRRATSPRAAR